MGLERALLFLALALLAEVAGTVGGFGSSVFFVPIANFFFDFQTVLGITAVYHLLSNLSKLGLFRGGIDKRLLLTLGVPSVLFALLGSLATPYLPVSALKLALALFLIVLSALLLWREDWQLQPRPWVAVIGGAVSGGMAGLVGTGGAVRGLTLATFNLPKEAFVATSAAIDMGIDIARAGVYWRNGYIQMQDLVWIALLGVVALIGTWIGRRLLRRIPQPVFRRLALGLVLLIGCVTLFEALR